MNIKAYIGKYYQNREQLILLKVSDLSGTNWDDFENSSYNVDYLELEVVYGTPGLDYGAQVLGNTFRLSVEKLNRYYVPIAEVKTRYNLPSSRATEPTFILIKDENRPVVNPSRRYWWSIPAWEKQEAGVALGVRREPRSKKPIKRRVPVGDSWETRVSNIVDDTEF